MAKTFCLKSKLNHNVYEGSFYVARTVLFFCDNWDVRFCY
jgi:hypothetical protein